MLRIVASVLIIMALAGCGGGDQDDGDGAFEPALAPSQPTIRKLAV